MRLTLLRGVAFVAAASLLLPTPLAAQTSPAPPAQQTAPDQATVYNAEQLDALLAQIALYPDSLLTQVLMASTYPLQVVDASRWLAQGNNKTLTGDALTQALAAQNWDPSVKSLIPFPQVLALLDANLDWTQQVGYAFADQQNDVWNSIQRLRAQAQAAGQLKTTDQQSVTVDNGAIVIQPANPQVVYVPVYNPTVVYGGWPYPTYPPVYYPPPPGYIFAGALATGLAFATGVAVVGSLWGWCGPRWYGGYGHWGGSVNVNVNRYNNINVNRPPLGQGGWRPPPAGGPGGRPARPPGGPVGQPRRPGQLPANAIGRPNVQVPGNMVRPGGGAGAQRPGGSGQGGGGAQRPGGPGQGGGGAQRPGGPGQGGGGAQRPGGPAQGGGGAQRPGGPGQGGGGTQRPGQGGGGAARPGGGGPQQRPAGGGAAQRPNSGGAFGGMSQGARAGEMGQRGAQSRNIQQQQRGGGGGGAARQNRGGGGASRPSGGGNRGGGGNRRG